MKVIIRNIVKWDCQTLLAFITNHFPKAEFTLNLTEQDLEYITSQCTESALSMMIIKRDDT